MRKNLCLQSFQNYKNKPIYKNDFSTTYFNSFFNKTMNYLVCDYFWACSRKSYLPCGETYDVYSYNAIVECLKAGARLIQLDIYNDEISNPVVRNKHPMPIYGKPLDFEQCIKLIQTYGWIDCPNYPLILFLSINTNNKTTFNKIAKIFKTYFQNRFLNKKYSFAGRNGEFPFGQIPISDLLGKIAIIVDKYPLLGVLNELINAEVTKDQQFITIQKYTPSTAQYGGLVSTNTDITTLINYNKFNITGIESDGITRPVKESHFLRAMVTENVRNPKSDIFNADPIDCWKFGCQWVMMNYQLWDKNMEIYIDKFKNAGLVLKPEELRYIPKPPPPINKQNTRAFYKPRNNEQKGWYNFNL